MAVSNVPLLFSAVIRIIANTELIDNTNGLNNAHLSETEWNMWHAFELCPVIEIWPGSEAENEGLEWKQLKP